MFLFFCNVQNTQAQYVEKEKRKENQNPNDNNNDNNKNNNNKVENPNNTQQGSRMTLLERLSPGGYIAGSFWGNPTSFEIAPQLGIYLTEKLMAGVGGNYIYYSFKGTNYSVENYFYSGRGLLYYYLIPEIILATEQEGMNVEYFDATDNMLKRKWVFNPYIGAGYNQTISGGRSGAVFMVLYNLNYDEQISPYASPWVLRVGFMF
ncbi:MAG: hypothetical protein EAZ55_00395 [Cytophagales bacterium]|nr:MAG: hypothetical protein EAZ55_00395 [Cytophagales bacterium]